MPPKGSRRGRSQSRGRSVSRGRSSSTGERKKPKLSPAGRRTLREKAKKQPRNKQGRFTKRGRSASQGRGGSRGRSKSTGRGSSRGSSKSNRGSSRSGSGSRSPSKKKKRSTKKRASSKGGSKKRASSKGRSTKGSKKGSRKSSSKKSSRATSKSPYRYAANTDAVLHSGIPFAAGKGTGWQSFPNLSPGQREDILDTCGEGCFLAKPKKGARGGVKLAYPICAAVRGDHRRCAISPKALLAAKIRSAQHGHRSINNLANRLASERESMD